MSNIRIRNAWTHWLVLRDETNALSVAPPGEVRAAATWTKQPVDGADFVRFCDPANPTFCLNIQNGQLALSSVEPGAMSAMWALAPVDGTDFFHIQNRQTGDYLNNQKNGTVLAAGTVEPLWTSAMWAIDEAFVEDARLVQLNYAGSGVRAMYNEVTAIESQKGTYFMAIGFDGGYVGLQETADGSKIAIFSVLDNTSLTATFVNSGTGVERVAFAGEERGWSAWMPFAWNLNQKVAFAVVAYPTGSDTNFSAYYKGEGDWVFLATINRPGTNGRMLDSLHSFVEDFLQNGAYEGVAAVDRSPYQHHVGKFSNPWVQSLNGAWSPISDAIFTADTPHPFRNIDGWLPSHEIAFQLATGGWIVQSNPLHATLHSPAAPSPVPSIPSRVPNIPSNVSQFPPDEAVLLLGAARYFHLTAAAFPYLNWTWTCWFMPGSRGTLFFYGNPDNGTIADSVTTSISLVLDSAFYLRCPGSELSFPLPALDSNAPHHVALTFAQAPGATQATIGLTIDGVQVESQHLPLVNSNHQPMTLLPSGPLFLATRPPDPSNSPHIRPAHLFQGRLSDIRIWSGILTPAQIVNDMHNQVFGQEATLYAAWPFDSAHYDWVGNRALDVTPAQRHAQATPISDTDLSYGFLGSFDQFPTGNRTIEMWIRCGNDTANATLVSYANYTNAEPPDNPGRPWSIRNPSNITINGRSSGVAVNDGYWHHLAITVDTTAQIDQVYVDGFLRYGGSSADLGQTDHQRFLLGAAFSAANDQIFCGQLRQVAVWAGIRTAQQIAASAAGVPLSQNSTTPLVAHWPLIDGATSLVAGNALNFDIKRFVTDRLPLAAFDDISSRAALIFQHQLDSATGQLVEVPVYRLSITCKPTTMYMDIWASEQVTVTINGTSYAINDQVSVRAEPNFLSKITLTLPATDLRCPMLMLRSNLMQPQQRHYLFPDIEAHKKLMALQDGDIQAARTQLGIADRYSASDLNHFQHGLRNIAKTVQHTYNNTPNGMHRDRQVLPINMQHTHFVLDFSSGKPTYQPLAPADVPAQIAGAQLIPPNQGPGFLSQALNYLEQAVKIVVHTVQADASTIVQTAENVKSAAAQTFSRLGEDIVHGDIGYVGQDLIQGGETIGRALVQGGLDVATTPVAGADQLIVLTLHFASSSVQYVIHHTGEVGRLIGMLFQKIGVGLGKVVAWLADKLDWPQVLTTQRTLMAAVNTQFSAMQTLLNTLKQNGDQFLSDISSTLNTYLTSKLQQYDVTQVGDQPAPAPGHSAAVEVLEWLIGSYSHQQAAEPTFPPAPSLSNQNDLVSAFVAKLKEQVDSTGATVINRLLTMLNDNLVTAFAHPDQAPTYLMRLFWQFVQIGALQSLHLIQQLWDSLIELLIAILQSLQTMLNAPITVPFVSDLYALITKSDTFPKGEPFTPLGLSMLLAALPITIMAKTAPISRLVPRDQPLPTPYPLVVAWNTAYGACHIAMTVTAPLADTIFTIKSLADELVRNAGTEAQFDWFRFAIPNAIGRDKRNKKRIYSLAILVNTGLSLAAQILVSPVAGNLLYPRPDPSSKDDLFEAPGYWSDVIWLYQWAGWGGSTLCMILSTTSLLADKESLIDAIAYGYGVFNGLFGIVHMAFMGVLDQADRSKAQKLLDLNNPMPDDLIISLALPAHSTWRFAYDQWRQNKSYTLANRTFILKLCLMLRPTMQTTIGSLAYWSSPNNVAPDPNEATQKPIVEAYAWLDNLRNYYQWAWAERVAVDGPVIAANSPLPRKGFGNIMTTFPEIGQIGSFPNLVKLSKAFSVVVGTIGLTAFGNLAEGSTVLVRTRDNELF